MKKSVIYILIFFLLSAILIINGSYIATYARYASAYNGEIVLNIRNPKYNVVFNANGGEGTMEDQEFEYDIEQKLRKNTFEKYGYKLAGWDTDSSGSNPVYEDEEKVKFTVEDGTVINLYATYENIINIRLTDLAVNDSSNASSSNEKFDFTNLTSSVVLNNANSYVTYEIDITNYLDKNMGILSIDGLDENLEYEIVSDYKMKTTLCEASSGDGNTETILLKIKYKDGKYNSGNTSYDLDLDFTFKPTHALTYEGIGMRTFRTDMIPTSIINTNYPINITTIDYPSEIMEGDTLEIEFYPNVPTDLEVTGTVTNSYSKPVITLSNATTDVNVKSTTMGEWIVYDHPTSYTFTGNNYINTQIPLFTRENIGRDFRLTFTIDSVGNNGGLSTLMNSMREGNYNSWPGFMVRIHDNTSQLRTEANGGRMNDQNYDANRLDNVNGTTKYEFERIDGKLYLRINDGEQILFNDFSSYPNKAADDYFDAPVTLGASLNENNPYRYFTGSLSNMELRWLDTGETSERFKTVYSHPEAVTFTGNSYLDTGIYLFSQENLNKDFIISFDIDNISDVAQNINNMGTLVNAYLETGDYNGFAIRLEQNSNDTDGQYFRICANNNSGDLFYSVYENGTTNLAITSFKFIRENKILYYQINDGPITQLLSYENFNTTFEVPITFGSSLDQNGNIYREFRGTMSNMVIKIAQY